MSPNKSVILSAVACAALAVAPVHAATAGKLEGSQYLKQATITLKQARAIALKACPGEIAAQELEKEEGGSGLRYSFDIAVHGVTHEVGVDAKTGKVLENSIEDSDAD